MIVLDMIKKVDVLITHKHYSLENGIFTLQIDVGDYDLTNKTITAKFNPSKVETGALEVVDGAIQIPIYSSMVQYGINYIQLNFRWDENKLEQSGKLVWIIDNSLVTESPAQEDVDIISYLINEIDAAKQTADRVVSDVGDIKIALDQSVDDAGETKRALDGSIETAGTAKTNLEGTIESADTKKTELINTIGDANAKINEITNPTTGTIKLANDAKTSLESKINEAGTAKSDIEQAIIDNEIVTQTEFIAHKEDYTQHLNSNMPHKMKVDGMDYKYGLSQENGFVKFVYEEVI